MSEFQFLTGISELWTMDAQRTVLTEAAVFLAGGQIAWTGPASEADVVLAHHACELAEAGLLEDADQIEHVDLGGRAVLPGWVDSHSHLVFDGDRSAEFQARMAGQAYAAGGIGVTTAATRQAGEERLRELVSERIRAARAGGTTCMETKTGYGLTPEAEALSARIAAEFADEVTYLGAHLVPAEYEGRAEEYVDLVVGEMLDEVLRASDGAMRWADVFCEEGAFTPEQSRKVLQACRAKGLTPRVHGNQLGESGGVSLALELGAASVDHLNFLSEQDISGLGASGRAFWESGGLPEPGEPIAHVVWPTVATVLPACDLSTRAPMAPARALLDAGAVVALASNCNPGTSYTSSMSFCVGTAVLQQRLSLEEALEAATLGGAVALRRTDVGRIVPGARADLHVLDAPAAIHLAYRPGMPLTHSVWRKGARVF